MRSSGLFLAISAGTAIAACSSSSGSPASPSGNDSGTPGVDGGGDAAASPIDGGQADAAGGAIVAGSVVDASTFTAAKNFDSSQYPGLAGVEVCAYGQSSVPCATTDASGKYTLGVPAGPSLTLSYAKTGYQSVLYAIGTQAAGVTDAAAAIFLQTTSAFDSFQTTAGATPDPTKGVILFGGGTIGAAPGSTYHEMFGPYDYYYAPGYTVAVSPAPTVGPVYTSADWSPDPALTAASLAGWGYIQATPGAYTLTYSSSTLDCGSTTTTVVAGYVTTYVGVVCTLPDAGSAVSDAAADAPAEGGDGG
jgi:hypothetical protein